MDSPTGQANDTTPAYLRDFKQRLEKDYTRVAACNRRYVFVESWKTWLRQSHQVGVLLGEAYAAAYECGLVKSLWPQVQDKSISSQTGCQLLVFSILLLLRQGHLIHVFNSKNITDRYLPSTSLDDIQKIFSEHQLPKGLTSLGVAKEFERLKWQFCPPILDSDMGKDYGANLILPIHTRHVINTKGGTARVSSITVPEEFVSPGLCAKVQNSKYFNEDLKKECYEFALKTFTSTYDHLFENEKNAFIGLRGHQGMIKYFGWFRHDFIYPNTSPTKSHPSALDAIHSDQQVGPSIQVNGMKHEGSKTSNILLQYGLLDLEEYFCNRCPPPLQKEIVSFWNNIFEIASQVSALHNLQMEERGTAKKFNGWHADIKPDNILLVEEKFVEEGSTQEFLRESFKLADPGFATFEPRLDVDARPKKKIDGGTSTYGAPERDTAPHEPALQNIDSWSLGCVLSLAATWMVLGYQGNLQFWFIRKEAIKGLRQSPSHGPLPVADDAFHDGSEVLQVVKDWHNLIRKSLRGTDNITAKVLDLVDTRLLVGHPESRAHSDELCERLEAISSEAQREPTQYVSEAVLMSLLKLNDNAPSIPTDATKREMERLALNIDRIDEIHPSAIPSRLRRPDRHSRNSQSASTLLMRVGNRSALTHGGERNLPAELPPSNNHLGLRRGSSWGKIKLDSLAIMSGTNLLDVPIHVNGTDHGTYSPSIQPMTTDVKSPSVSRASSFLPGIPNRSETGPSHIEARKEMDERSSKSSWMKSMWRAPDKALQGHFADRDIIFLVDNGQTMLDHWDEVNTLIDTIMVKVKDLDDDGIDLYFTDHHKGVKGTEKRSKIRKKMEEAKPRVDSLATNMAGALGCVFKICYDEQVQRKKKQNKTRRLTIFVLTDGIWGLTKDDKADDAVDTKIVKFIKMMIAEIYGDLEDRFCTLQFVQFGNNEYASERLRRLDDDLHKRGIPDVVDSEPVGGNFQKILLGSISPDMDAKPTTPHSRSSHEDHVSSIPPSLHPSGSMTSVSEGNSGGPSRSESIKPKASASNPAVPNRSETITSNTSTIKKGKMKSFGMKLLGNLKPS